MRENRPIAVLFGGSGMVGRAVTQELAQAGWQIRIPTRNLEKTKELKPYGTTGQIVPLYADAPSDAGLATLMKGADAVVNLIGSLQQTKAVPLKVLYVELAARIARLAKAANVHSCVHISAHGADEKAATAYHRTKAAGEKAVSTFFPESTILQPNLIYGPYDRTLNPLADIARISPLLPMAGWGEAKMQPIYVGDVARAVRCCLEQVATKGCIFELNGSDLLTQKELLQLIAATQHKKRTLIPVPWALLALVARLPFSPLSPDLIRLWQTDYTATSLPQITDLGIKPRPMDKALAGYL
ncbi:MAG: complex I NDUFA9 subunit family protein [Bdellovibrionales bacterium]